MGHESDVPTPSRALRRAVSTDTEDAAGRVNPELVREVQLLVEDFSALLVQVAQLHDRVDAVDRMVSHQPIAHPAQLMSVSAAARRLGVSRATMYRMVEAGQVDVVVAGATKKVSTQWLDDFVNGRGSRP